MKNKNEKINYENLESPEELELKEKLKKISKILGIFWGLSFIILIIVPLFDFALNQFLVSTAYYFIVIGLIYFIILEFSFDFVFKLFKKIVKPENKVIK
ncbi:MAG: hypothetical protein KAR38_02590 [Calditrichia bacterium]|nr:hypothetical protein [Calditrichia bacterium]